MALQSDLKQFIFAQGIDTRIDPALTPLGKLQKLENGKFDKTGAISKKNGSTLLTTSCISDLIGPSTRSSAKAVFTHKNALYAACTNDYTGSSPSFGPDVVFGWSPTYSKWSTRRGCSSIPAETFSYNSPLKRAGIAIVGSASSGNLTVLVMSEADTTDIEVHLIDNQTQTEIGVDTWDGQYTKVIAFNGFIYVFYSNGANLRYVRYDPDSPALNYGSSVGTIATNMAGTTTGNLFDVYVNSSSAKIYFAYNNNAAGMSFKSYTSLAATGTPGATDTASIAFVANKALAIFGHSTNTYVAFGTTGVGLRLIIFNNSFAVTTALATLTATEPLAITGSQTTVGSGWLMLVQNYASPAGAYENYYVTGYKLSTTGVLTSKTVQNNMHLHSKIFAYNNRDYVAFAYDEQGQRSLYVAIVEDLATSSLTFNARGICKLLQGRAGPALDKTEPFGCYLQTVGTSAFGDADKFAIGVQQYVSPDDETQDFYAIAMGVLDFSSPYAYQTKEIGGLTYVNGGILGMFDGSAYVEQNFLEAPSTPVVTGSSAGGGLVAGSTYFFSAVYEWYDANGNRHQSAPSIPTSVTLTGGQNYADLSTTDIPLSWKSGDSFVPNAQTVWYRTEASGTVFYRGDGSITDSQLIEQELLYTTGDVLDNWSPVAVKQLAVYKERLFALTDDGLFYSKQVRAEQPVQFNPDLYISLVVSKGKPTAIAALADKLLIFYKEDIYYISGDGPNDTGFVGSFSAPQLLTTGVGCLSPAGVLETETSVFFHSRDGIKSIDRTLGVQPIGKELDYFVNENTVFKSAVYLDQEREVRFSDGTNIYCYDTYHKQWMIRSAAIADSMCVWNGLAARVQSNNVYLESASVWTDNGAYSTLKVATGWINMDVIQGFQRCRKAYLLARYRSAHTITVNVFYDYVPEIAQTFTFTPDAEIANFSDANVFANSSYTGADNPLQFEMRLAKQKCQAIRFEIYDGSQSGTGQSLDLVGIALEVAFKRIGAKLRDGAGV